MTFARGLLLLSELEACDEHFEPILSSMQPNVFVSTVSEYDSWQISVLERLLGNGRGIENCVSSFNGNIAIVNDEEFVGSSLEIVDMFVMYYTSTLTIEKEILAFNPAKEVQQLKRALRLVATSTYIACGKYLEDLLFAVENSMPGRTPQITFCFYQINHSVTFYENAKAAWNSKHNTNS